MHDRQAYLTAERAFDLSSHGNEYWRGQRFHSTFHNPGRGYQGHYQSPLELFRMIGTKEDFEALQQKNPTGFQKAQEISKKYAERINRTAK